MRIRWPKSPDFGPKSDYSVHRILNRKKSLVFAAVRGTQRSTTINALEYEYNHDAQTQSPRLSATNIQLDVGRRGLGPINRDQEERRTQRASFVAMYHTREHKAAAAAGHRAGLGCLIENNTTWSAAACLFVARLESVNAGLDARVQGRAKYTRRGPDIDSSSTRSLFRFARTRLFSRPDQNLKLRKADLMRIPFRASDFYFPI